MAKDTHHLYLNGNRGYQMRFSIVLPNRTKRMKRTLKTKCKKEAIARRDLIFAEYNHLGLKLARFNLTEKELEKYK